MAYKKCILCGKAILPTEDFVPYKGRFVHQNCFDGQMKQLAKNKKAALSNKKENKKSKEKQKKTQAELKDGMSEEDYAKKRRYYNYLKQLVEDESLTAKQFSVSEKYIARYNFTFEGMYQTLVYLNEIKEKDLQGDIVGIIPYYYAEAEQFYKEVQNIADSNKSINLKKLYPDRIIYIKPSTRKIKTMDIEDIGEN